MFFFNDEFDLHDEDQYDLFTLATHIQRRSQPGQKSGSDETPIAVHHRVSYRP